MSNYGESYYGEGYYNAGEDRFGTELTYGVVCRVVPAPPAKYAIEPPPVFDSWVYGLAERFNWLQQAIQTFGFTNKIEYASGSSLDNDWGEVYNLPRLTGESDADFRARIQTYTGVLTGSGTPGNVIPLLNFLIGKKTGIELYTRWPAQVIVTGSTVDVLRAINQYRSRLDSVLPGLFAAGVDYTVLTPYAEYNVIAHCAGDRAELVDILAVVRADIGLDLDIEAAVAKTDTLNLDIEAAVQADLYLPIRARAAVVGHPYLDLGVEAAVVGHPYLLLDIEAAVQVDQLLEVDMEAAIQADRLLELPQYAAVAKTFEMRYRVLSSVWLTDFLEYNVEAAVQHRKRELTVNIKCRVKKRAS